VRRFSNRLSQPPVTGPHPIERIHHCAGLKLFVPLHRHRSGRRGGMGGAAVTVETNRGAGARGGAR